MDRGKLLNEAQTVLLRGLAKGYASGTKAQKVPGRPGWKFYEHTEGRWYLRNEYYVDPKSGKSVGITTLEWRNDDGTMLLVWFMSYGGFYKKEAGTCLKAALLLNYTEGVFNAGRGRYGYMLGNCEYLIRTPEGNSFERFSAHETIIRIDKRAPDPREQPDTTPLGGHEIWGMAVI